MTFRVDMQLNISAVTDELKKRLDERCGALANLILGYARKLIMTPPKSGRQYRRGKKWHQASAPGESPATDTGALVNNSMAERMNFGEWTVAFMQEYAAALELGTPRMAARPYLRPAAEWGAKQADDVFRDVGSGL